MSLSEQILGWSRPTKRAVALLTDGILCLASVWGAYYLRTGSWPVIPQPLWHASAISVVLALPLFVIFGLYRAIFRYSGMDALATITKAVAFYALPICVIFTAIGIPGVPRTMGVIQPIVMLLLIVASRGIASGWLGQSYRNAVAEVEKPRMLIYGAGASGRQVAAALAVSGQVRLVGFLDDNPSLWNATLIGLPVYRPDDLLRVLEKTRVTDVLLAINKSSRTRRNEIIQLTRRAGLHIRTMPGVDEMAKGKILFNELKELEIEDLLGRAPIPPDLDLLEQNIAHKIVMVTGAGGSIGSEICRQVARIGPEVLLLVDSSEYNLYAIHQEITRLIASGAIPAQSVVPLLANVRDRRRVDEIVGTWEPHSIYHAAAYKHVPLVEQNLLEGLSTNVIGTVNVALSVRDHGVENLVLISTDKAVRPTNVMGATKRLAEIALQALAAKHPSQNFSMVRFGNVLGSSGSVVPLFRTQIAAGGPITITHPEITRYFMTIPEAAELVIQAGAMAKGGEVFVLDMGDPIKVIDLARLMIELSGLRVRDDVAGDGDIAIEFVGLRPGEKLYEELLIGDNPTPSDHPRIMCAHEDFLPWDQLEIALQRLDRLIAEGDAAGAKAWLREMVPEFVPSDRLLDLVSDRRKASTPVD